MLNISSKLNERFCILRKTGASISNSRLQKMTSNPLILPYSICYFVNISTHFFTNGGNFIDKTNLCCQKRIGGVLDHFCTFYICFYDRYFQWKIELFDY